MNENGYAFTTYKDYGNYGKAGIICNDIDATIEKAKLEHSIGSSSIYFLMLGSAINVDEIFGYKDIKS